MTKDTDQRASSTKTLQPLTEYSPPAMPTDETIRRFGWKIWKRWQSHDVDPFITNETLDQADEDQLDLLVAPPAYGSIVHELDETFKEWTQVQLPARRLHVVVVPPCDQENVVQTWATRHGHPIVPPPDRELLCKPLRGDSAATERLNGSLQKSKGDTPTVIPNLERWFLRHHDGLGHVVRLFESISEHDRKCVLGCSSWAWSFLCRATQASLILPSPVTLVAFDAQRLSDWLAPLAEQNDAEPRVLRFSESGKRLFGEHSDRNKTNDHFTTLAARSRGIPWVAWHLWRRSLRTGPGPKHQDDQKFPEERTVWVSALEDFTLPNEEADAGLLILQSLLIHERLTLRELDRTIPSIERSSVLAGLIKAGFVQNNSGEFRVTPAAYPAIRARLSDAGFPLDKI